MECWYERDSVYWVNMLIGRAGAIVTAKEMIHKCLGCDHFESCPDKYLNVAFIDKSEPDAEKSRLKAQQA